MDLPQPITAELEEDLQNLRQLNRFFGGHSLVSGFLCDWIRPRQILRALDLATGSGDIPRLVVDYARRSGAQIKVAAVDQQASTLEIARELSVGYPEITFYQGDILEWSSDSAYDIVLCTLALHHFGEEDAVRLLRQLSRTLVQARFGFRLTPWVPRHGGNLSSHRPRLSHADDTG